MARPQSDDYDTRKGTILDIASKLFASSGYHKASMSEVAKACGMSKSLIYHYYSSKQDILYHAMMDHVIELDKLARDVMAEQLPAEQSLKKIIRRYLHVYENTVSQHHLLINELGSLTDEQHKKVITIQNSVVEAFADLAEQLSPTPLSKHKAKTAVSMLMLGMINWTYIWFKPDGDLTSDQVANIISDMFISGLRGLSDDTFNP